MPCPKAGHFTAAPRTPVVSFWRSAACGGRAGPGAGQEIGRANGRSLFSWLHLFARRRFPCARRRFWHGKPGLEDAFQLSRKTRSQTPSVFSPRHFNDLGPWGPSNPPSVPYSGTRGPESEISEGLPPYFCRFLPPALEWPWERYYVLQFRRLNHQAEHSHRRPTRPPNHRQVTKIARYPTPRPSFDPAPRLFLSFSPA